MLTLCPSHIHCLLLHSCRIVSYHIITTPLLIPYNTILQTLDTEEYRKLCNIIRTNHHTSREVGQVIGVRCLMCGEAVRGDSGQQNLHCCGHAYHNHCVPLWCRLKGDCPFCDKSSSSSSEADTDCCSSTVSSTCSDLPEHSSFASLVSTTDVDPAACIDIHV